MAEIVPKVSVVIPTYNRAHLISRATQSILDQSYRYFELIIVDDASADDTEKVVMGFNDERIRYIRHAENKGVSSARNTGIKAAKCGYIAFHDDDDEWMPEKLEKQMRVFQKAEPEVGVVYTGCYRFENNKKTCLPSPKVTQKEGYIFGSLLKGNFIAMPAVVIKRECFEITGMFDESISCFQDWELFIRISKAYHFKYVDEPLVLSYYQPDSITANRSTLVTNLELILEKHSEDFRKDRRALTNNFSRIGDILCSDGKLSRGRGYLVKAFKIHPLNIEALCAAVISLLGLHVYNRVAESYRKVKGWFSKGL